MDAICTIPTKDLYDKAVKNNIPFHKWHVWIENQLTNEYIKSLYEVQSKQTAAGEKGRLSIFPF